MNLRGFEVRFQAQEMADGKQMSQQSTQNSSAPWSQQSFHMRRAWHEIQQHPLPPFQFLLLMRGNKFSIKHYDGSMPFRCHA